MAFSMADEVIHMARRTSAIIGALLLILAPAIAGAATQRMLLPPQSFTVPAGGSGDAQSYCLDKYASEPAEGVRFQPAPAALGDISVTVPGKGTHSLQAAIKSKFVEVVGNGGFETVTFRNLTSNLPITVSIKRNSVVLPPDNAATDDIADLPAFGSPGRPALDQSAIWKARAQQAHQKLGQLPAVIATETAARRFGLTHDRILANKIWTANNNSASAEKTFVLQRAMPFNTLQPLYLLYKPNGQILAYEGNGNLGQVVSEIKQSLSGARARVVLIGEGDDMDYDAARLTMETAAGGGSGGNGPGAFFNFQPPSGSEPPGGGEVYRGGEWEGLVIARSEQRLSATQRVFHRGNVTVYSKTAQLLGRMAAAVRRVTAYKPLAQASREELIDRLRESIQYQVSLSKAEDPTLNAREGNTPAAEFVIDKTTEIQRFTDVSPAVQPEAQHRVAANDREH